MSFEIIDNWMNAIEERQGDYVGHIDFVANKGGFTENDAGIAFWEKGSGINFETKNNTHKKVEDRFGGG